MPTTPRSPSRPAPRPASRPQSAVPAPPRPATRPAPRPAGAPRPAPRKPASGRMPTWSDLGGVGGKPPRVSRRPLDIVPSVKFGLLALLAALAITLFVGHVYATQATLAEAQALRRDNLRLHLANGRLRGVVDQMTGPDAIMSRAAELGLEEGVAYGPTVRLQP